MKQIFLCLALLFLLPSCRDVNWPGMVSCGVEPAHALVDAATKILNEGGNVHKAMEDLARKFGPEMVICVVRSLVAESQGFASTGVSLSDSAKERGREFLHQVGH